MTLDNCDYFLGHFNKIIDGTIPRPENHKNWADVILNSRRRAKEMELHIKTKTAHIKSRMNDPHLIQYHKYRTDPRFKEEDNKQKETKEQPIQKGILASKKVKK